MASSKLPRPGDTTIAGLLAARAADAPDEPFAIFPDCGLSYAELDRHARVVAKGLMGLGVKRGSHVAVLMPNCPHWLLAYFGTLYAGATVVALNARYKRHELAYTLEHSDAEVLLTTDAVADHVDFAELVMATFPDISTQADAAKLSLAGAPKLRSVVMFGPSRHAGFLASDDLDALGAAIGDSVIDEVRESVAATDVAALMYTSGTTANPKGCALTHVGLQRSWFTFGDVVDLRAGEKLWMPMPFFHTGGIGPMTAILARGGAFVAQAHFDPGQMVELIAKHRVEHLYSGFPQFSLTVLQHEGYDRARFGFVRSMVNVGPPAMQRTIQDLLPADAKLLNLFGMTEGAGIVSLTPWDASLEVRANTSGSPPDHTDVRVIHPETGAPSGPDEPGEIQFRGGGAFAFYYKDPKATAETIIEGGWVRTGDRGKLDRDGWLYYLGRLKDMLKVGGENVAAAEIEFFLAQNPGVKLVQVIGAPDARMGEVPVAFVERAPGSVVTGEELIGMCQGELAKWKIPRDVVFVSEWPMSSTKVQKFKLRELLPERYRDAVSGSV
jgi:fatty-acyl-CoA synthase